MLRSSGVPILGAAATLVAAAVALGGCRAEPKAEPHPTVAPASPVPQGAATPVVPTTLPVATTLPAPTTLATAPTSSPKASRSEPPTMAPPSTQSVGDPRAARVAGIVGEAQEALAAGKLKEAGTLFDDALALDPSDTTAKKGKAIVTTTLLGQTRTLVPDLASSEGAEGRLKHMAGFDDVEERDVRRAVKVPGRAELDGAPAHIKPGEPYKVEIYLRNLSTKKKRNIKVSNVGVKRIVNDKETKVEVDWKAVEVQPKQRILVTTVTGAWEDDVSSWILDVKLLSESNDIYENRLVWK